MQAIANAKSYAWGDWLIGIMRSFLSGGAGALLSLTGSGAAGLSSHQTVVMVCFSFVGMGLYRLGEFLQLHGAPDPVKLQEALDDASNAVEKAKAVAPNPTDK